MPRTNRYSPEVRERAVRMVAEHRDEYPSEWAAFTSISAKLGMTPETLRTWVRRAQVDEGLAAGAEHRRAPEAEGPREGGQGAPAGQRNIEGRLDFLRDRARRSTEEVVRYIDSRKDRWGVEPICTTLQFASRTYYAAKRRPPCARKVRDEELKTEDRQGPRATTSTSMAPTRSGPR